MSSWQHLEGEDANWVGSDLARNSRDLDGDTVAAEGRDAHVFANGDMGEPARLLAGITMVCNSCSQVSSSAAPSTLLSSLATRVPSVRSTSTTFDMIVLTASATAWST